MTSSRTTGHAPAQTGAQGAQAAYSHRGQGVVVVVAVLARAAALQPLLVWVLLLAAGCRRWRG